MQPRSCGMGKGLEQCSDQVPNAWLKLRAAGVWAPKTTTGTLTCCMGCCSFPSPALEPGCSPAGGAQDPWGCLRSHRFWYPWIPPKQDLSGKSFPAPTSNNSVNTKQGAVAICWLLARAFLVDGASFLAPSLPLGFPPPQRSLRCPKGLAAAPACVVWLGFGAGAVPCRGSVPLALCCHGEGLSELQAALAQTDVPACTPAACPDLATSPMVVARCASPSLLLASQRHLQQPLAKLPGGKLAVMGTACS